MNLRVRCVSWRTMRDYHSRSISGSKTRVARIPESLNCGFMAQVWMKMPEAGDLRSARADRSVEHLLLFSEEILAPKECCAVGSARRGGGAHHCLGKI